jgi:hypothetical protein
LRIDLFIIKKNCHLNLATTFFEYDGAHHFIESSVRNDKYRDSSLASMGAPTFRMQHIEKKGIEKSVINKSSILFANTMRKTLLRISGRKYTTTSILPTLFTTITVCLVK